MRLPATVIISFILFSSCRLPEESLVGTYKPKGQSSSRLILHPDHSFELSLLHPKKDSLVFPEAKGSNFYTRGTWKTNGKRTLILSAAKEDKPATSLVQDSIARFTHISSFSFWNRYGEPVPIRYIRIPPSRPKPHFGNSLFFFAQDFKNTDTLEFHFDGYAPVRYPGTVAAAIGNNTHKITLTESYLPASFDQIGLQASRNKIKLRRNYVLEKK